MTQATRLMLCKYPGGKSKIEGWVRRRFPPHDRYVEAFAGSASILINKPRCASEWLIERDAAQATLLRVLCDHTAAFVARLSGLRHRRDTFDEAKARLRRGEWGDDLDLAVLVYLRRQLSWAGEGGTYSYRSRRELDAWWARRLERLPLVGARLAGVQVIEGDALEWIPLLDGPETLTYCDPPYVWSSRTEHRAYRHEMTDDDHARLLEILDRSAGKVAISGYPNALYDDRLGGWRRVSVPVRCHAYSRAQKARRTEVLWMSY